MAKKFGKILLATAALGTAAAAAYYFMHKKDAASAETDVIDEDYDDFSDEDLDDDTEASRNYVELKPASATEAASGESAAEEDYTFEEAKPDDFTPLTETIAQKAEETVEEFLGDETTGEEKDS